MTGIEEIATGRLIIRPLRSEDLAAFVAYRREPAVARYQSWDTDFGLADAERLLAEQEGLTFGQAGAGVQLAVVERADGLLAGDCFCYVMAAPLRTAEIGVTLAPARQGRGLAGEAVGALVGALFEGPGVRRVIAQVDDRNRPIQRLLDGLGFRLEARLVEADWFKGEWTTLRIYAVLASEWPRPGAGVEAAGPVG